MSPPEPPPLPPPGLNPESRVRPIRTAIDALLAEAGSDQGGAASLADLTAKAARLLLGGGLPLDRLSLSVFPLQSGHYGPLYLWEIQQIDAVRSFHRSADFFEEEQHRNSVFKHLRDTGEPLRLRLESMPIESITFDVPIELKRDGFTDYLAESLFSDGSYLAAITLATRRSGGFRGSDLQELQRLVGTMGMAMVTRFRERAKLHAWSDPSTGLINRRRLEQRLAEAFEAKLATSLLLFDLDDFAAYNRQFGYFCADDCLMAVSRVLLAASAGQTHLPARFGGDIFALVLAGAQAGEAEAIGRQVLAQVLALRLAHPGSSGSPFITVRVGLAVLTPADGSAAELVSRAQEALSVAKEAGGNCLIRL